MAIPRAKKSGGKPFGRNISGDRGEALGILLEMIQDYFRRDDWNVQLMEDRPVLRMGFGGRSDHWNCVAIVYEDREQFVFYSVCRGNVSEDRRNAVAEYLTRANYGLTLGNFEMDYEDGEVRYKTSIDFQDSQLTFEQFRTLVYSNVLTMDRYLGGLRAVMYEMADPAQAIAEAEIPLPPPGTLS